MPAIETRGLTKHFGEIVAVDDLDLTVHEGEIFGFLGPNGAGKSTTIDILLDFVRPTSGEAIVLNRNAQEDGLAVRQRTGVLPDAYHVYDRLTGRQHVEFAIDMKETGEDPLKLLERVGIPEAADRNAGGYSRGMRQRLAFAMALVGDPDLLILDEPSTGLDPNGAREMRQIIREENERGATVFFSSHVMEQVEAICDRVGIINRGQLVAIDSIEGLREASQAGDTLLIELSERSEEIMQEIRSLPTVLEVTATESGVRVTIEEGHKLDVLNTIDSKIIPVEDFSVVRSSLEDLFVQYTNEIQEVTA